MTATLKADRGDQSLDFGAGISIVREANLSKISLEYLRLSVRLSVLLLGALNLPTNDILPDIVLLRKVKEPPNLSSPLGTETLGEYVVGQTGDFVVALLDNNHRENSDIGADDATANGFALALTGATGAVA